MNRCVPLIAGVVLALSATPGTAMSERKEAEVGKKMYDELMAKMHAYANPQLTEYVNRIGTTLVKNSDRPDLQFTFTILDSPDINAFATPGGYVYVYRGLIPYLDSEAELAGVLAHEIAHVTERHASRQEWMAKGSNIGSAVLGILAAVTTGSGAVGGVTQDAASTAGTAMVRGYGRDMELEADRVGARTMHKAGYDPLAMIEVLSALTDQENFARVRARKEGTQPPGYHGVFSTHPRNDERLKEVVSAAGKLEDGQLRDSHAEAFRQATEGMKFSEQPRSAVVIDNRYYNGKMGFTLAFPSDWKVARRSSTVLAGPNRDGTILQMGVKRAMPELSPRDFATDILGLKTLTDVEQISGEGGIEGFTARFPQPGGAPAQRVAVVYFGSYAYVFQGRTQNAALLPLYDTLFLSSIRSFRTMGAEDRDAVLGIHIDYVEAPEGMTFERLAETSPVRPWGVEMLRLVNGYYPRGEPEPGEWIKVFR